MTFEQQLHDQLVGAARRGRTSSRVRPLVAASAIAALAIGVLAVLVLPRTSHDGGTLARRAQAPPGVAQSLYDNFAVLRRPRTAADELPKRSPLGTGTRGTPAESRLVADRYGVRVWMVPGIDDVCTVTQATGGRDGKGVWGSAGCGRVEDDATYAAGKRPIGSTTTGPYTWRPHRLLVTLLLPDGTTDVQLRRGSLVTERLTVQDNAVSVRAMSATSLWWRARDGSQRHLRFAPSRPYVKARR